MRLPHEIESQEYWAAFDWVMQEPSLRAGPYVRPMFEIEEPAICELPDATEEYCVCFDMELIA